MQKDSAQIKGIVNLVLRDNAGRVKQHKTIRNLVTDYGLAHIVGRMIDNRQDITGDHITPRMMSHMAIGYGDYANGAVTATTASNRSLEFEPPGSESYRVQVKRDTSFSSEYSTFTVEFPDDPNFTRATNGSNVIRVAQTTNTASNSYFAKFIRAPSGGSGTPIMTVEDTNTGGATASFPAGTGVQSITVESGGILAITLTNPITVQTGGWDTAGNNMQLTFKPIQSQFGRLNPNTGVVETTVDVSGGGDPSLVTGNTLGGLNTEPTRGIIGGYYNGKDDIAAVGIGGPIPPFFGDADEVPLAEDNTTPFVQFGTSVDGVFQGKISGSSVILDSGTTPEGYPTNENDYGQQDGVTNDLTQSPYNAVAGTKKTGTRVVYVATFKENNPTAPFTPGGSEAPIREAGIFNKEVKDTGISLGFPGVTGIGAAATVPTSTGGLVKINEPGMLIEDVSGTSTGRAITQTMLCRTTFSVVNKATDDTLQITWSVQLKDTP